MLLLLSNSERDHDAGPAPPVFEEIKKKGGKKRCGVVPKD